jgi:hypothetical protein
MYTPLICCRNAGYLNLGIVNLSLPIHLSAVWVAVHLHGALVTRTSLSCLLPGYFLATLYMQGSVSLAY